MDRGGKQVYRGDEIIKAAASEMVRVDSRWRMEASRGGGVILVKLK